MRDRPVTFRTLDIGGDKVLPYMASLDEENPALGWRAIRIGLDRPGLLRSQIRALLRAGAGRETRIMFPMIADVAEFDAAKRLVDREVAYLARHDHPLPTEIKLGAMVEVPSLLWQLDELARARRLPVRRLERPDAISLCGRSRQQACFGPLRSAVDAHAAGPEDRSPMSGVPRTCP